MKANYTIEAAFVLLPVIGVILSLWFLGCHQYNSVCGQSICQEAVYKAIQAEREQKDGKAEADRIFSEQKRFLLAVDTVETSFKKIGNDYKAIIKIEMTLPFMIWNTFSNKWVIEETCSVKMDKPVETIRNLRRIKKRTENGG